MAKADIDIVIGAQDRASATINKVAGTTKTFGASFAALGPMALGVGSAMAGAAAGFVTLGAAVNALVESTEKIVALDNAAASLGASVSDLQGLQRTLGQIAGVDADTVTDSLKEMQLRIGEIASGVGSQEQIDILAQLGLDAASLAKMDVSSQFKAIQNGISEIENVAERASIADKLIGGDSVRLLNAFGTEAEEFNAKLLAASDASRTLSDEQAAAVKQMNAAVASVMTTVNSLVDEVTAELAPVIEAIALELSGWMDSIGPLVQYGLPLAVTSLVQMAGYATDLAEIMYRVSIMDLSGAFDAVSAVGERSEAWLAATNEARQRAEEGAAKSAEERSRSMADVQGLNQAAIDAANDLAKAEETRQANLEKTFEALERELLVLQLGADEVQRREQLALAVNDTERERIAILQSQVAEQERMNRLVEEQNKMELDRMTKSIEAAEQQKQKQDAEEKRIADAMSQPVAQLQATESRLLTRGPGDNLAQQTAENTKESAKRLAEIDKNISDTNTLLREKEGIGLQVEMVA